MISKSKTNECYVYIVLLGETTFVTAGKFEQTNNRQGIVSGKFVYGRKYFEHDNAVAIDPLEFKLSNKTYETNKLKGMFGSLRDASPDYWGRRVIEKHTGQAQLGPMCYLLRNYDASLHSHAPMHRNCSSVCVLMR